MGHYFHSVTLDEEKCKGCTNCIKRCPTEAIRVREGKARITEERCIDCGECIRVCPYHAKKAVTDPLSVTEKYKYKVALPAPSMYGQFKAGVTREQILHALARIGFNEVFEVAKAAEVVSDLTMQWMKENPEPRPLISSACPAVVRLIQVKFPDLIPNLVNIEPPMEAAAKMVKYRLKKEGMNPDDIGVFFITPCPAKATSVKSPLGNAKSYVDGVISINEIYIKLLGALNKKDGMREAALAGSRGIRWARTGGESVALDTRKFVAVDGIHNVISILEEIENDKLENIEFVEALACTGGCLGGPLTVENGFVARSRLKKVVEDAGLQQKIPSGSDVADIDLLWHQQIDYNPVMMLDKDISAAIQKMETLEQINANLPGLDCGACGAPSCRALAEDIVRGYADEADCIFKLREKVRELSNEMMMLEDKILQATDKRGRKGKEDKK